jgi:hypothetical protein
MIGEKPQITGNVAAIGLDSFRAALADGGQLGEPALEQVD